MASVVSTLLIAAAFFVVAKWRKVNAFHLFERQPRLTWLVAAFPVLLLSEFFASKAAPVPSDPMLDALLADWTPWQAITVIVILAPLVEEYIFRGALLVWLRRHMGALPVAFITAFGWAALHVQYDLPWMSVIAAMGILLAYVRLSGGSLWLTIGLHAANNALALSLIYLAE